MTWLKRKDIMLAQPLDDKNLARIFKDASYALIQPKLDGERAWVRSSFSEHELISSTGKEIKSVPHINLALEDFLRVNGAPLPLDGELYIHYCTFEYISSIVGRTANLHEAYTDIEYYVFDTKLNEPQGKRTGDLIAMYWKWIREGDKSLHRLIKLVPTELCYSTEEVHQKYSDICAKGYEGIIVRHPNAPYKDGRPWTMLKFKPKKEDIYDFVKVEEAFSDAGEPLKRVGAIVCQDGEGRTFSVGTGAGYTHDDLQELFRKWLAGNLLGYKVRVQYQNLTETGGVPRFGKFIEVIP